MTYHLALSGFLDLEDIKQAAQIGKRPAHVMFDISQHLNAKIHQPSKGFFLPTHLVCEKIIGCRHDWLLARNLSTALTNKDVVFCADEYVGIPIAALCGGREK